MKRLLFNLFLCFPVILSAQVVESDPVKKVNVFLGTSGDHGQLSPAASYPFGLMSIGPQTYPKLHAGYEHSAKIFLGFTHNRFEGVGCQGSGGNILIKPFIGEDPSTCLLIKEEESASPGFYQVSFKNGIKAQFSVFENNGSETYSFPDSGRKGFFIDLKHTLANRFVSEAHEVKDSSISGWIESKTTCNVGTYRLYYYMRFKEKVEINSLPDHQLQVSLSGDLKTSNVLISFSSVDSQHAQLSMEAVNPEQFRSMGESNWNGLLNRITVKGDPDREKLFYSLLYRTMQSPYNISEKDGSYRATDGSFQTSDQVKYNGWAIWDNYRTQLPLMAILFPEKFQGMVSSIAEMYQRGKKDYATQYEPSNTVRTEHAGIVLLDAYRKGFRVEFDKILDSMIRNTAGLDFSHPDKALESSYDTWALAHILAISGNKDKSDLYLQKAKGYKDYWNKDFKDLTKPDIDKVSARGMYQGTVWQYRWLVPFDLKGLIDLTGGQNAFTQQLDHFFDSDYYNHANEPDIQAPLLYNVTSQPWKSQALMHKFATDTVVQYYFNDNSRGIDPFVDKIYKNQPKAFIRTMDDDAGAMSAWYVFAASGFFPASVGWPVYYLNVPLFEEVTINPSLGKSFTVKVDNYSGEKRYIQSATLNGKTLTRNWITHDEITEGGILVITAADIPNKLWGIDDQWVPDIDEKAIRANK